MIVQQSNWIDRMRRAAGSKGPAQLNLMEDIYPVIQAANLDAPEYDYLGRVKRLCWSGQANAVAGQISQVSIFNPLGSGLIGIVYRIGIIEAATLLNVETLLNLDTTVAVGTAATTDGRWGLTAGVFDAFVVRSGAAAAGPSGNLLTRILSAPGAYTEYDREWVLPPGVGYAISGGLVNQQLLANIFWKERPLESGEA